jgi:hypothetical protein
MSVGTAVDEVTKAYSEQVAEYGAKHAQLVAALAADVEAAGFASVEGFFTNVTGEVIGELGAKAANMIEDEEEQESAFMQVEGWVFENVTAAGIEPHVLCAAWYYGPERVADHIQEALSKAAAPKA